MSPRTAGLWAGSEGIGVGIRVGVGDEETAVLRMLLELEGASVMRSVIVVMERV